jgi:tetratricopeptide (TPR) repeat protein
MAWMSPNGWSPEDDNSFSAVVKLKESGDLIGAKTLLLNLVSKHHEEGWLYWYLGHIYWRLGDLELAVNTFKRATAMAPQSERASLGLFHCLWQQGKTEEAMDEVARFMAIADSEDYREILAEINSYAD